MGHALVKTAFGFGVARFSLGIGESGNFPAAIKATAEWFPKRERALATGLFNSGANIGAVVAPLVVPWITLTWGWQEAFIFTGLLGFIWIVLWVWLYEIPEKHKKVTKEEIAFIVHYWDWWAKTLAFSNLAIWRITEDHRIQYTI